MIEEDPLVHDALAALALRLGRTPAVERLDTVRAQFARAGRFRAAGAISSHLLDVADGPRAAIARPTPYEREQRSARLAEAQTEAEQAIEQRRQDAAQVAEVLAALRDAAGRAALVALLGLL